jgi:Sec-independent protein translocase protein TatA
MTDLAVLLLVILIFAILFRGPKTLPVIGRMLGRGVRATRSEASEIADSVTKAGTPKS